MIQNLIENQYCIIRNFIDSERAKNLAKEFIEYCKHNKLDDDFQVPDTPAKYNYISFLELLCEKTPEVSNLIGENVLPTFCYSRVYKNGDVLKRHTDRDACEVSLTIHLDSDKKWEIYIENSSGKKNLIDLNQGDALLYLGCDAPHWRDSYTGSFYSQLFMHYIRSRGARSYAYFDNKNRSFFSNEFQYLNKTFVNENKSYFSSTNPDSKLQDFILTLDNVIDFKLCDEIVNQYKNDIDLVPKFIKKKSTEVLVKNSLELNISNSKVIEKNYYIRNKLDKELFKVMFRITSNYVDQHPELFVEKDTGFTFSKYQTGSFCDEHLDCFGSFSKKIFCIFFLNDDYEGGEFAFFNSQITHTAKKGSALIFPSNYLFPYQLLPITKGERYSISTFIV